MIGFDVTFSGIVMQAAGDARYSIEIQESPNGSTGWVSLAVLPPLTVNFVDFQQVDGVARYYRARSVEVVNNVITRTGPFLNSTPTNGKPKQFFSTATVAQMLANPPSYPMLRSAPLTDGKYALKASDIVGKETDDDVFISASKTVKVGTVASPGSITKTLRIPFGEFMPDNPTRTFNYGNYLNPGTANTLLLCVAPAVLPVGVTITGVAMRAYRQTSNDFTKLILIQVSDSSSSALLNLDNTTTTGWQTTSGSVSQLVGSEGYVFQLELKGIAAQADARFSYVEITYTVPSYDKGY